MRAYTFGEYGYAIFIRWQIIGVAWQEDSPFLPSSEQCPLDKEMAIVLWIQCAHHGVPFHNGITPLTKVYFHIIAQLQPELACGIVGEQRPIADIPR